MDDWKREAEKLRAWHPEHLLFLCVANSARSQIAEGVARSLAPADIKISSAGSNPSTIRPEVVEVLKEIGIDASSQYSKGLKDIDTDSVKAVIRLCADEVCPVFLRPVLQFRWPFPDPAAAAGTREEKLQAFRDVRDELMRRLRVVF